MENSRIRFRVLQHCKLSCLVVLYCDVIFIFIFLGGERGKETLVTRAPAYYVPRMVVSGKVLFCWCFRNMPNTVRNLSRVSDLGVVGEW